MCGSRHWNQLERRLCGRSRGGGFRHERASSTYGTLCGYAPTHVDPPDNKIGLAVTFIAIPNEGKGDCAYLAIAQALAGNNNEQNLNDPKLKAGGAVQAKFRLFAAKEVIAHPERYPGAGPKPKDTANAIATAEVPANSTAIFALAQTLDIELRIWKYEKLGRVGEDGEYAEAFAYTLNIIRPLPSKGKKQTPKHTAWLHLRDEHYEYLKPRVAPPAGWMRLAKVWTPDADGEDAGKF